MVQIVTTLARGGAQATVLASADLARHGVAVTVLAGAETWSEGDHWADVGDAGLDVVEVPGLRRRPGPMADTQALVALVRLLRSLQPDVVHTHSTKAGVLGRLAAKAVGVPVVHTVHGWGPLHARSRAVVRIAAGIERALARVTDALVVVGEDDLDRGLTLRIGRPDRYHLIRSGIEVDRLVAAADRRAVRSAWGLDDRFVIGMVARMAGQKDHVGLIEAFARADLSDAVLVLVGDGAARAEVEGAIARWGVADRVRLLGAREDAARLVAGFDVSVLSSWYEGMPRTVLEAVALGVPVVASDVGSIARLVEPGVGGRLVPIGDRAALTAALVEAHRRPEHSARMAAVARTRIDEYSADRMRADLVRLWAGVAGGNPKGAMPTGAGAGQRGR